MHDVCDRLDLDPQVVSHSRNVDFSANLADFAELNLWRGLHLHLEVQGVRYWQLRSSTDADDARHKVCLSKPFARGGSVYGSKIG